MLDEDWREVGEEWIQDGFNYSAGFQLSWFGVAWFLLEFWPDYFED